MLFNSTHFALFFPIILFLFFAFPHRHRWMLLLGASYYFYGFFAPEYLILLFISTAVAYFAALQIPKAKSRSGKRFFLILSIFTDLGMLFWFKYAAFFSDSMRLLANQFHVSANIPALEVFLPIGISFYTFQNLSYVFDVYRGQYPPERHFGRYALFVSFFPQLVAGPIERASHLLPQLSAEHHFNYTRFADGLKIMLWGFFKKIAIADRLAMIVDLVYPYAGSDRYTGWDLLVATYAFAFQIYCDFSGYSDIAIGAGKIMGVDLMDNFNRPYAARTIRDFWRRWHISLVNWLRDYIYIPLGGNRLGPWRWYYNMIVVFLLSGFWHGANWTMLMWGGLHGFYMAFGHFTSRIRKNVVGWMRLARFPALHTTIQVLITFHLVVFAWVFFRAKSIDDAFLILNKVFHIQWKEVGRLAFDTTELSITIGLILIMEGIQYLHRKKSMREFFQDRPTWFRWGVCYLLLAAIILFAPSGNQPFIYFQF